MQTALRITILLFSLFHYPGFTQIVGSIAETSIQNKDIPFTIISYSTKDGLPQNQVSHILRRKNGELLVHTSNGIVSFNGYRFAPISNSKNYKKKFFKSLHYFEKNDALVGLDWDNKLYSFSPDYKPFSIEGCRPVLCLSNKDSLLIICQTGNVYLYDPYTLTSRLIFKNKEASFRPSSLPEMSAVLAEKKIYLNTENGIFCIDPGLQKVFEVSKRPDCHVLKKKPYNGLVYAVFGQSIASIRNNRLVEEYTIKTSIPHGRTADILFPDSSSCYLATMNGLVFISKNKTSHYTKADGLPSSGLQTLFYDSLNQCLFVGSTGKGLLKLLFKNNFTLSLPDNHYERSACSIIRTSDQQLLTSAGQFFYRIGENVQELFAQGPGKYASLAEINGYLYVGTWDRGVLIYKHSRPVDTLCMPQIQDNAIHACYKDSKGMIWIGTEKGIARGKDKSDIKPFLFKDIHEPVLCFYELRNGQICIGSSNGAYIIDKGKIISRLSIINGFRGKEVRSFYEDASGKIWIGTYGGGLYCYNKGTYTSINAMKNCMLYEDAFCVVKDRFGYLYMTSNRGLWRVSEKDLNAFYEQKILSYIFSFCII